MRKHAIALVCLASAALALGGCAEFDKFETWATSAKGQATVAALKAGSQAIVCDIAAGAALAGNIEASINAGQSVQGTDGKIYTVSSQVCQAMGGTSGGTAVVK
jgi:hypothetical protein